MFTKATVWLVAACLILIVQASVAYELKPCHLFKGKIISAEVHNCPNKTAEYCEIGQKDTISWDVKYTNGVTYTRNNVNTGINYGTFWPYIDQCGVQPEFCPGKQGEERANHFEFELRDYRIQTGIVAPLKLYSSGKPSDSDADKYIVCVELPVKFLKN